ncbi:MAG: hypothetical protein AW07_01407 [Candidatus Accumulibacter sp. SK-11]|nr:MAG: hypothetical protein AW07_01407 [Candidatus Accumulibacter sp. SK-11]
MRIFSWKRLKSVERTTSWMSSRANCRVSQSSRDFSPMPPVVVSRLSTSGSPLLALRPFGQPASASSRFASASGLRCARPSTQS